VRVLIAIHGFPPTHYAGSERAAERIARWLVDKGHHVEVFTIEKLDDPNTHIETAVENGITIHRLFYDLKGQGDYFENLYDDPRIGNALRSLLETRTFDVMHVVSGYLLGGQVIHTAKAFNIPVVLTLTEFWFMCFRLNLLTAVGDVCTGPESDEKCMRCVMEDQRRFRLPAERAPSFMDAFWSVAQHTPFAKSRTKDLQRRRETLMKALAAADVVVCPSQFLMNLFRTFGFNMSKSIYVLYGLKHPPTGKQPSPRPPDGTLRLGYVGQIKPHKGVDLLLDTVMRLLDEGKAISLTLWGSSSGAESYGKEMRQRTLAYPAIQWKGSYSSDQLWDVLGEFDTVVVPSRWYENNPTVILESFLMRIPVIATKLGSMPELVKSEKSGLVFELNDANDLNRSINRLLDEPDLLERLRAGIPKIPTIDDEVGAFYAQYQKLTGKS